MRDNEFYQQYANLPLSKREEQYSWYNELLTPNQVYKEIKEIDDKIRKDIIRKENLIRGFENYLTLE